MLTPTFHRALHPQHATNSCRLPCPSLVQNRRASSPRPVNPRPLLLAISGPSGASRATRLAGLPSESTGTPALHAQLKSAEEPSSQPDLQVKALFWERARRLLDSDHHVRVTVKEVGPEVLTVAFGPLEATLAWPHLDGHDTGPKPSALHGRPGLVGRTLKAGILEVNQLQDYLWLNNASLEDAQGMAAPVEEGQVLEGRVTALHSAGAFIALQGQRPSLKGVLLHKDVSSVPVLDARQHLSVGQELKVFVSGTYEHRRASCVALSTKLLELEPGDMVRDPRLVRLTAESVRDQLRPDLLPGLERAREAAAQSAKHQEVGQVVQGVVQSTMPYGVFVDLGNNVTGLLHISQISSARVKDVQNMFAVGQLLKVKVLKRDLSQGRVTLSTKALEPSPGDMVSNPQLVFDTAEEVAKSRN